MTLLTPLGLLGLLGIVALIIIYIIKPNFQQKFISSTFIWKLSLKRKKKKVPISKLRNLLIIICQILIITACAAILTTPSKVLKQKVENEEIIIVIDSSASMRAEYEGYTRFERAVDKAIERANQAFDNHGIVSVIVADDQPAFFAERITEEGRTALIDSLIELGLDASEVCYYGKSDLDAAVVLAAPLVDNNPLARFAIYTDSDFHYVDSTLMTVVNVGAEEEWNAAILEAKAELVDGIYEFTVDVATYGVDKPLTVTVNVTGANRSYGATSGTGFYTYTQEIRCISGTPQTIVFTNDMTLESTDEVTYCLIGEMEHVYTFDSVFVSIAEEGKSDSFVYDDTFFIYGGQKPIVRIQYASSLSNNFFNAMLMVLKNAYRGEWDIRITEVNINKTEPATEGFDIYIFEHSMPSVMPEDGVVMMIDPNFAPQGSDIRLGRDVQLNQSQYMANEMREHAVMKNLNIEDISISRYTRLAGFDTEYEVLASCDGEPMILARKVGDRQTVIMPFSVHYSNISVQPEFMLLFMNLFNYYFPKTVEQNAFEVGAAIPVNARGEFLDVSVPGSDELQTISNFPNSLVANLPGAYTLEQRTYFGKDVVEQIYVKIPAEESDIKNVEDTIATLYVDTSMEQFYEDLLFWLALALVSLLFIEWILHSRENR